MLNQPAFPERMEKNTWMRCARHPDRLAAGFWGFDDEPECAECLEQLRAINRPVPDMDSPTLALLWKRHGDYLMVTGLIVGGVWFGWQWGWPLLEWLTQP